MSSESSVLAQIALSYAAMIDRNRAVSATRLSVFPLRQGTAIDSGALLDAMGEVWPVGGPSVALNALSEQLVRDLLVRQPGTHIMLEVPSFMACDPANTQAIMSLFENGNTLLLKGRPLKELPREVLPCFKHSIIDLADDRRVRYNGTGPTTPPAGVVRTIAHIQTGVHTVNEMEASFQRGAVAVLGWPIDDVIQGSKRSADQPGLEVIVQLIDQVHHEEAIEKLENTLKRDPPLAYKLLRYINSPAFGIAVEISSFRHAIMILGYQRLKRWLALLLATASKDVNMRPVIFASVRRGLLMEELVRNSNDEEMRSEMFICGVFSLLDRMFRMPFSELLENIPVPERVYKVLADGSGPYKPYFDLVKALEGESLDDIHRAADSLMIGFGEINRAMLRALRSASQLD